MDSTQTNNLSLSANTQLQQTIQSHLGSTFPALALTVFHQGRLLLDAAWGWLDPETSLHPVTCKSLFDLASVTKLYVATAFLSIVSEGRVQLDDALVTVIPEFGSLNPRPINGGQDPHTRIFLPTPPAKEGQTVNPECITFRHLLTHTSGLAPWRAVYEAAGPTPAPPDEDDPVSGVERWANGLKALCEYSFIAQPDEAIHYSDLGLMLLGEATSRLHDTPGNLAAAVQARVLTPLGLDSVTYNPLRNGRSRDTIPPTEFDYSWRQRRCWGEVHDENACGLGGVSGHAGLFACAHDVAALGQAWLSHDPRLNITPEIFSAATRIQADTGPQPRGLGWMVKAPQDSSAGDLFSPTAYGHTGFTGTSLWIDPERELVVACLTNRVYPGREKPGIHTFRRALHDTLAEGIA